MKIFRHQQHDKFLHEGIKRGKMRARWCDEMDDTELLSATAKREEKKKLGKRDLQRFLVDVVRLWGSRKKVNFCSTRNTTWCLIDSINVELSLFTLLLYPRRCRVSLRNHLPTHSFIALSFCLWSFQIIFPLCWLSTNIDAAVSLD